MLRKREKEEVEIPSSSMADIAFLLLVFFLVCTTIDVDKGLNLVLPPESTPEDQVKINPKNIVNLLINDAGEILLDREAVAVEEIRRIIEKKLTKNSKLIVSLKTTRGTRYKVYVKVLDELKKAKATRVSIAEPEDT